MHLNYIRLTFDVINRLKIVIMSVTTKYSKTCNKTENWANGRKSKNDLGRMAQMSSLDVFRGLVNAKFPTLESNVKASITGKLAAKFVQKDYYLKFARNGKGYQLAVVENVGIIRFNGQSKTFKNEIFNLSEQTDRLRFLHYARKTTKLGDKSQKYPMPR